MHSLKHENSDWGKQTDLEQAPLLLGALVSSSVKWGPTPLRRPTWETESSPLRPHLYT